MRPREAAKALGIGERKLWDLTNQNKIPHLRLGRAVIYPVQGLKDWLANQSSLASVDSENQGKVQ